MAYKSGMLAPEMGAILKTASIKKCICTLLSNLVAPNPMQNH